MPNWPPDEELLGLIANHDGDLTASASSLSVAASSLRSRLIRQSLWDQVKQIRTAGEDEAVRPAHGVKRDGDTVTVTMPRTDNPELGDYAAMLRERGLDPDDWVVVSVKANEWDAMTSDKAHGDNQIVRMKQWTITLKPSVRLILFSPAVHVPQVKRTRVGPPPSEKPETVLIESDHHFPYHDPGLHEASLLMVADLAKKHRLAEQVFLGDTLDLPNHSRHPPSPTTYRDHGNSAIQCGYSRLREKVEAAPGIRRRKVKGNHDWRLDSYTLTRAPEVYGLRPAQEWENAAPEVEALSLRRLLHLDKLNIELIEDERGWEHAEVDIVPGPHGLGGRHGWITGAGSAEKSVKKRGRSIVFGHIHTRQQFFWWNPTSQSEMQGIATGTMGQARGEKHPDFVVLDGWLQGCVIVTRWPDGSWQAEHVRWTGKELRWRDRAWRAAA